MSEWHGQWFGLACTLVLVAGVKGHYPATGHLSKAPLAPLELSNAHALPSCCVCLWPFLLRGSKPEPVKTLEAEEQAKIEAGEAKPSVGGMKPGWEPKRTIAVVHDNSR